MGIDRSVNRLSAAFSTPRNSPDSPERCPQASVRIYWPIPTHAPSLGLCKRSGALAVRRTERAAA